MPSHSKSRKWALKKFPCEFAIPSHLDSGTLCAVIGPSRTDRIGQGDNPDVAIVLSVIHPYSVVSLNVPPIAICAPLFVASTFQNNLLQRRRTRIGSLRAVWEFEEILRPRREGIEPIARHVATLMTKHQVPQMSVALSQPETPRPCATLRTQCSACLPRARVGQSPTPLAHRTRRRYRTHPAVVD